MKESVRVSEVLTEVMVGATLGSIKLAGPELELFFIGGRMKSASHFSIDTDASVFVVDANSQFRPGVIPDNEFLEARKIAIIGLYELTGYDIEHVSVDDDGRMLLQIGNKLIIIYPVDDTSNAFVDADSWSVIGQDVVEGEWKIAQFDARNGYS